MDIAHWNHNEDDRLDLVNVGTPTDTKLLRLNANLRPDLKEQATALFKEFIDIFAFSYDDL
jgi:hypothetical protein